MRLSIGRLPWSLVLATLARAADTCTFDPGNGGDVFELPAGVHSATRKVEWPPTTLHETVQFNLCSPLAKDDQVAAEDQVRVQPALNACAHAQHPVSGWHTRLLYASARQGRLQDGRRRNTIWTGRTKEHCFFSAECARVSSKFIVISSLFLQTEVAWTSLFPVAYTSSSNSPSY